MAKVILKKILDRKKISYRQFAKLMNYSETGVYRWLKETWDPRLSTLQKIARRLKLRVRDLIDE
jgi:transcriptional regulator with XRE-family HTH domain